MMRGGPWGGGGEPNLRARPGSGPATFRRIVGFFSPYRLRLAWIAGLIVVTVTIGVINPILLS